MFWFGSKERAELVEARRKITQLQNTLDSQFNLAASRLQELNQLKKELQDKSRSCSVAVDFEMMDAFSIERMHDGGVGRTVIGYLKSLPESDPDIGEWTLYCNEEIHEKLVKEFIEYQQTC
jgi:hypothetical protein